MKALPRRYRSKFVVNQCGLVVQSNEVMALTTNTYENVAPLTQRANGALASMS